MDFYGNRVYAKFKGFQIGHDQSKYVMTYTSYSGNGVMPLNIIKGENFLLETMTMMGLSLHIALGIPKERGGTRRVTHLT